MLSDKRVKVPSDSKWTLPGGERRRSRRNLAAPAATVIKLIAAPQTLRRTAKERTSGSRKLIDAVIKQRISDTVRTGRRFCGFLKIIFNVCRWIL